MWSSLSPFIVWFRDDLRVADNPALAAAVREGRPVLCVYVYSTDAEGRRPLGGAARWWLHGALAALDEQLSRRGNRLVILRGHEAETLKQLAMDCGAAGVFWNRRYDGGGRATDAALKAFLKQQGIACESFNGHLLREPWEVESGAGKPFRVYSAFWRAACARGDPPKPLSAPREIARYKLSARIGLKPVQLDALALEPKAPDWAGGMRAAWRRGETGGHERLKEFLTDKLDGYAKGRDVPEADSTSRLSPFLRFGNVSARQVWHAAAVASADGAPLKDLDKFIAELGWREFAYHVLYHSPELATRNVQLKFDAMAWRRDQEGLRAWQRGQTGYPIVDAGMRELWATGWMHNRVRMITASFLSKHLLIDWRAGEAWFWDTLVDADPANNPFGWQWVAGSGADAAPFFRVFNPVLQGEKFDPMGHYVKRWVPELRDVPSPLIHKPWQAGAACGTYPDPIVDHDAGRARALEAWRSLGEQRADMK